MVPVSPSLVGLLFVETAHFFAAGGARAGRRAALGAWGAHAHSPHGSVAVYLAPQVARFVEVFGAVGDAPGANAWAYIEGAVGVRWNYVTELHAPCCSDCKPWSPQPKFCWGTSHEDAKENVVGAVPFLQNIAPEGVMVLPVQTIEWLSATVHLEDTSVIIKSSKTDYIFIPEAAWVKCQEDFGAELFEGWKLRVKAGMTTTDALLSMFGSIIGLYEAKTEKSLNAGLLRVRAQALLEYLAVNHMKDWPTNDVIVMFGDLNRHYVVHAGRKDAGKSKGSIHVASPAQLPAVAEHAPTTAEDGSPESVTLGFIRALLGTRRTDEAGSRGEGAANSRGAGASGSGGGASGSGGGASGSEGGASSSGEGASGSGGGASGSGGGASGSGGGAANSRGGGVSRNGGGANGSGDAGADGGSIDAYSGSRADSSGGEGSCSSCADSPDGGVDGDEGLREAARENAYAQACMSLLRLPEVYEPMGLTEPPTSFRPATKEEYLARFRPANTRVGTTHIITSEQDGLHEYDGNVFVNPPFGKTATAARACFPRRRAALGAWGAHAHSPHGSVAVYLAPQVARFVEVFGAVGDAPGANAWAYVPPAVAAGAEA
ncbi:hypothetical protein TSOC_014055 [Tetrabaena socialis]|uniref:Uncharacterized protein n=1 Tax=Tetrabaena socialis TaxID=47790 RepID=A0A2J7ZIP5_9CHLO|nr:hypothetical protein TSOC_014055 [Tetrabaena socialis]|eukprot:PNH00136.1 hypothetical protein TSOC_014055 [Tetrabaena socialis]